jgi:hypothetical protein
VTRRTVAPPEPRRPRHEDTPAQRARQAAIGEELRALARVTHPERFAADGTPLIRFAGSSWTERRASYLKVVRP